MYLLWVFYLYLEFCAELHCVFELMEISIQLMDNVLAENYQ